MKTTNQSKAIAQAMVDRLYTCAASFHSEGRFILGDAARKAN